jgi:hypothetical protein
LAVHPVRGDRDTGGKPARLALLKAGQRAPLRYEPVVLQYDKGIALMRILLVDRAEFPTIAAC